MSERHLIYDLSGNPVDISGPIWRLNGAVRISDLDWTSMSIENGSVRSATQAYFIELIKSQAPQSVHNAFKSIIIVAACPSFVSAVKNDDVIPFSIFSEAKAVLAAAEWRLHYLRDWYRQCADRGYDNFSAEVAFELEQRVIGGNQKGIAVRSLDPTEGPLIDLEVSSLLSALNVARRSGSMSVERAAALWLCIAFGSNPSQLALLREEDVVITFAGDQRFVNIRIPRIKKRTAHPRSLFRERKLTPEIADIVLALVEANVAKRLDSKPEKSVGAHPLFVRKRLRDGCASPMLEEYACHLYANEFTDLVKSAVDELGVLSCRTGEPLRVNPRRLRYTFARRLVREGASRRVVADALDHTDLQNVGVYFDIKSDVVESLDHSMALALGPRAQAFMGTLIRSEAEAVRGEDPGSRIMMQAGGGDGTVELGSCGQYSFCSLFSPIACYTCKSFQPWMDGPHHKVLDLLLRERERRHTAGQDGRMVSIHDTTILAVGDVIQRIDAIREHAS